MTQASDPDAGQEPPLTIDIGIESLPQLFKDEKLKQLLATPDQEIDYEKVLDRLVELLGPSG